MKVDLSKYANTNICVAVSGGRDSMALLHYLLANSADYGICVSAVNFDHKMRGEASVHDSAFVAEYCKGHGVPLLFYEWTDEGVQKTEASARNWRMERYIDAAEHFTAAVATAHHLNDNAETVLFNLARGSGLSGLTGIEEENIASGSGKHCKLIRPFVACSREEIDAYIAENKIPYVNDETNFTDDYTRNKIRHNVLTELEKAVPGAANAIYRFSRIAAEDEEYFKNLIEERGLVKQTLFGYEIATCIEKSVFKRAALQVVNGFGVKDYTSEHLEKLYQLQFFEKGKKFEFLGLTAYSEEGKIAICIDFSVDIEVDFISYCKQKTSDFGRQPVYIEMEEDFSGSLTELIKIPKTLKFDLDKIPQTAVIRFMREGDKFKKFGGGTKNLGDYFTDKKIPVRIRKYVPVIADGNEILIACGVEISDKVKVDSSTRAVALCVAENYLELGK